MFFFFHCTNSTYWIFFFFENGLVLFPRAFQMCIRPIIASVLSDWLHVGGLCSVFVDSEGYCLGGLQWCMGGIQPTSVVPLLCFARYQSLAWLARKPGLSLFILPPLSSLWKSFNYAWCVYYHVFKSYLEYIYIYACMGYPFYLCMISSVLFY